MSFKRIINDTSGSSYIDAAVQVLITVLLILIVVTVLPVFSFRMELSGFARDAAKKIERYGCYDNAVQREILAMAEDRGLNPTITVDTEYIPGTNYIQMNDSITVTVSQSYDIGFWIFGSYPIPLKVKATGMSEVFYK